MILKRHQTDFPSIPQAKRYPPWAPRFWNGVNAGTYARLLWNNRYRIHPSKIPMTILVGACTPLNSILSLVQKIVYTKKISQTKLIDPPIFIIGHWRSGTTLLHEILVQDNRFGFSSTFDCFVPQHFLISRLLLSPILRLLFPKHRPMDNMAAAIDLPQEDEFAMFGCDVPTPYWRIAFCNQLDQSVDLLNFKNCDESTLMQVHDGFSKFYQALTLRDQKPLILKSPTHTGRLAKFMGWFPNAKFIHISRDPHQIIPSTMRLWQALDETQSFQRPKYTSQDLLDYIFHCFQAMYDGYFSARGLLSEDRLIEVRFEDLVANPLTLLASIYEQLQLDQFEKYRERFEDVLADRRDYQPQKHELEPGLRRRIDAECQKYMSEFGY